MRRRKAPTLSGISTPRTDRSDWVYRLMARRMRGCQDTQAPQLLRGVIDMPADIAITATEITVRFHRRAHLPIVLSSGLFDKPVEVLWWDGRSSGSFNSGAYGRYRRLRQHSLPGGLLGFTCAGLAQTDRARFAGALGNPGYLNVR
jgi:hypothetical protein